ncbi:unnamed protein product [Strongylus vulgaris]|uniref:Uncharacterized protein n=1 Tax=Strongylus vulgaris TaxID=40348 RepID=A0A3P7JMS8_STRVU|nr:unnamed protein product [Strongylus vulgaris]
MIALISALLLLCASVQGRPQAKPEESHPDDDVENPSPLGAQNAEGSPMTGGVGPAAQPAAGQVPGGIPPMNGQSPNVNGPPLDPNSMIQPSLGNEDKAAQLMSILNI